MVPQTGFACEEEFDALCEGCTEYAQAETGCPFVIVRKDMDEGFRADLNIPDEQDQDADDAEAEGSVELDAELQWLIDHFLVQHFDSQDHGIFDVAQCLLHLGVPRP